VRIQRSQRGFTLIELLVVIAIIGILASIVLASLNSARQKGRDAKRISDVKQLQLALELYYDGYGAYPTALSKANLVDQGYISVIPTDPNVSGACIAGTEASCYAYTALTNGSSSTCTRYHLGTSLEGSTNSALASDVDAAPSGNVCSGSAQGASDFTGVDSPAAKCRSGDSGVVCYDATP